MNTKYKVILFLVILFVVAMASYRYWLTKVPDGAEVDLTTIDDCCGCGCSETMDTSSCDMCCDDEETSDSILSIDDEELDSLLAKIASCEKFSITRIESQITNAGTEDYEFELLSESKYIYYAASNTVKNVNAEDITDKLKFSISSCENALDFMRVYFDFQGLSSSFYTDDVMRLEEGLTEEDVTVRMFYYDANLSATSVIKDFAKGLSDTTISSTFSLHQKSDGEYWITYVTVIIVGLDDEEQSVVRYITYEFSYEE